MKKITKVAALLATMALAAGLSACRGKVSPKKLAKATASVHLVMEGATIKGYARSVLANLVIPKGVEEIGESAFEKCMVLESVTIPATVTMIGNDAFDRCKNLKNVTIDNGVTFIGDRTFVSCTSLSSVSIPASVMRIGYHAFNCDTLKEVKYAGTKAQWNEIEGPVPDGWTKDKGYIIAGDSVVVHCKDGDITVLATIK